MPLFCFMDDWVSLLHLLLPSPIVTSDIFVVFVVFENAVGAASNTAVEL